MDGIGEYLIGVIAAALVCSVVTNILDIKGTVGLCVKMLAGILMLLAVIRPRVTLSPEKLLSWSEDIQINGSDLAASGEAMADKAYRQSIIQQTQAYIVDEARTYDCELSVEVILSDDEISVPERVHLTGEISPYAKQALSTIITERLGIKREDQIWT